MTATFFFLEDVDRSLELVVGFDDTRVADYHTTLDVFLVDTTEEQTYVITGFTFVKNLTEHLNTGNGGFEVSTKTHDLYFVTHFYNAGFDTAGSNCTTTCDREYVFDGHQEGFVHIARRQRNPSVDCVHKFHDFLFPFGFAVEGAECRTTDDGGVFAIIVVLVEKFAHIHFHEFEHFLVVYHIAFVQEHYDAGNVHLASQKDVLTCLGHRTVGSGYYNDSAVHLGSTCYHVLYVVGVSGAVYVCIVTILGFVFYVCGVDGDTTLFFLGSIVDLIEGLNLGETCFCQHGGDGGSQGSFAVVHVTNGTDVNMRFGSFEFLFCHNLVFCICYKCFCP